MTFNFKFNINSNDASSDEEVDQDQMRKSFQEIWGFRTQQIVSQIHRIKALIKKQEKDEQMIENNKMTSKRMQFIIHNLYNAISYSANKLNANI